MGYGIIDIWVRWAKDCSPAYGINWQASIKDCSGKYPLGYTASGNKQGVEGEDDPPQGIGKWVSKGFCNNIWTGNKAHAMAKVPPGCYVVDAYSPEWKYDANETMVVVSSGETVCVNLLVGNRGANFIPPILVAAAAGLDPRIIVGIAQRILPFFPERVLMPEAQFTCLLETTEPNLQPVIRQLKPLLTNVDIPEIQELPEIPPPSPPDRAQ